MRIEPKVFFANERTFLSWLNFAAIIGGLAVGLLTFGDLTARITAVCFTVLAILAMIYALATFHWRASRIGKQDHARMDDRFGPTVLTLALVIIVAVNFGIRLAGW